MTETGREEVGHARVSLFIEEVHGDTIIVPTDDDVSTYDLGELVSDRIISNGKVTLPSPEDRPAKGGREELGVVYWDDRGIPTRLIRDDDVITFTENGAFDEIRERCD